MKTRKVKDLMVPLEEYATVSDDASLHAADRPNGTRASGDQRRCRNSAAARSTQRSVFTSAGTE